jgi:3',5'-cyclic AMP phosphodiesterase CpdA
MNWMLHISDPHLGEVPGNELDDEKEVFEHQPDLETSQTVFVHTLTIMDRFVAENGRPALALVSGDLTYRNRASGFQAFKELLAQRAGILPEDPSRIVVVPGNHDVAWDEKPATRKRYAGFLDVTRALGCTTPLIDGIDFNENTGVLKAEARRYHHHAESEDVLAIPLNTSNFCGIPVTPRGGWTAEEWKTELQTRGLASDTTLLSELKKLHQQDIARISKRQVEALAAYLAEHGLADPAHDDRLRVAVLHHQLLPLSTREERKAFESIVNLELLRQLLRDYGIHVVAHGHKHESAMYWHTVGAGDGVLSTPPHRCLVVSAPGRFDVGAPTMRAIILDGSRRARNVRLMTFAGAHAQRRNPLVIDDQMVPVWQATMESEQRPQTVVAAANAHTAYARIRALFELEGENPRLNVVCEVEDPSDAMRLPPDYPPVPGGDRDKWLAELVEWWQLRRSELVGEGLAPFNHGERIHTRWGEQVDRVVRSLKDREGSSRALILLMAPRETGRYPEDQRDPTTGSYPALVLVEFAVVERDDTRMLDCFAYFRVQEMQFWWTVNVAELARLQEEVRVLMEDPPAAGRIVTYTAVAHWKTALPRVAVPAVDLLVEDGGRLSGLAFAVAYPKTATVLAREDWARILDDLSGVGREEPPRPRVGAQRLRDEVARLATAVSSPKLTAVAVALQEICLQYAAFENVATLTPTAAGQIRDRVQTLTRAVNKALVTPQP